MGRDSLADITGYSFARADLLRQALTHRSFGVPHNERLEFLGDGVLNCIIAALLFERFTELPEGDLSRLRANLVNQHSLFEIAQEIGLGNHLLLGEGEVKSGGAQRPSMLADAVEALIGAVYLDAGFAAADALVRRLFQDVELKPALAVAAKDAKTELQELLQGRKMGLPVYRVVGTLGAAHKQTFDVECEVSELGLVERGIGASRRAGEQAAASAMLLVLKARLK